MSSKLYVKFKSLFWKFILLFDEELINKKSFDLSQKINPKFSIKNFDELLSFYGMNSLLNRKNNLRNKILLICFCLNLFRVLFVYQLDPVKDYKFCIYAGDFTLLFKSLRKFFIFIWFLLCTFGISLNYLFNYSSNIHSFQLFRCLDGTLPPKSVGINDIKILKKILILTKVSLKLIKKIDFGFNITLTMFSIYLILQKTFAYEYFEIVSFVFWFPITILSIYFVGGIIMVSNFCFNIICIYCLMTARCYNELFEKYQNQVSFGWRRFIFILKLKHLFRQQEELAIRILKYNQFWRNIYLMNLLHFIPGHIVILQQILFGNLNMELRFIYIMTCFFATIFIASLPLLTSFLHKQMKFHHKQLFKIQFNPHFNFDINTKLKVSQSILSNNLFICFI